MMAFAVEDHGVGIPKDEQQRVFERFESRSQGSKHRGAGLGLSIVKSLVELHGGTMSLEVRARPRHARDRALPGERRARGRQRASRKRPVHDHESGRVSSTRRA